MLLRTSGIQDKQSLLETERQRYPQNANYSTIPREAAGSWWIHQQQDRSRSHETESLRKVRATKVRKHNTVATVFPVPRQRELTSASVRQALRFLARNTSLPQRIRAQAQLQLSQMHCYTRPTQIQNRCVMGGVARGVFRAFRMGRVRCSLAYNTRTTLTACTVPISDECISRQPAWRKEGKLVD